ncbi:MAG: transcriptional repressor LexA [Firmicutes bacterium]|nr:transcriptional repressor LexA [Bacillota bacterium]MDY2720161.1 transcriptional repressor LexA [Candidatus Faecousia sp.]
MPRTSGKKEEILAYLSAFTAEHGYAPSIREICRATDLHSTASVYYHLQTLSREGRITMDESKKRAISVNEPERPRGVPVIGLVTAGQPILAYENIEGYLPLEGRDDCFALRVRGDSMVNAGILSGDRVIVRPQSTADSGDIVVALLEDEATVKRLVRSKDAVWLMPENPAYTPIDGRNAVILGKVEAVYREY